MLGTEENGNGALRVPFTEDGSKTLTLEHASAMLCAMFEHSPDVFGYFLSWGVAGTVPKPPGRRERV